MAAAVAEISAKQAQDKANHKKGSANKFKVKE